MIYNKRLFLRVSILSTLVMCLFFTALVMCTWQFLIYACYGEFESVREILYGVFIVLCKSFPCSALFCFWMTFCDMRHAESILRK